MRPGQRNRVRIMAATVLLTIAGAVGVVLVWAGPALADSPAPPPKGGVLVAAAVLVGIAALIAVLAFLLSRVGR